MILELCLIRLALIFAVVIGILFLIRENDKTINNYNILAERYDLINVKNTYERKGLNLVIMKNKEFIEVIVNKEGVEKL